MQKVFKRNNNNNNKKKPTYSKGRSKRGRGFFSERQDEFIYFEDGLVIETLPGTLFKVKVSKNGPAKPFKRPGFDISKPDKEEEETSILIICNLKSRLITKRVLIIKGDNVVIQVNPEDMYYDNENKFLKGTIIQRK